MIRYANSVKGKVVLSYKALLQRSTTMTTQTPSVTSITEGQRKQYYRFVEDAAARALKEVDLSEDGIEKLFERGDEFQAHIINGISRYANEGLTLNHGYLTSYKPKSVAAQTERLRKLFRNIGYADEKLAEQPPPLEAEGWFAIPRWERITDTYAEAVQRVLVLIKKARGGKLKDLLRLRYSNPKAYLRHMRDMRQHEQTLIMLKQLGDQQNNYDILVVPAQFGIRHQGRSVCSARETFEANEFGLGTFQVACMLLTHPERLQYYDDLRIDCPGDTIPVYNGASNTTSSGAPYFGLNNGEIIFGADSIIVRNARHDSNGSASGFIPASSRKAGLRRA